MTRHNTTIHDWLTREPKTVLRLPESAAPEYTDIVCTYVQKALENKDYELVCEALTHYFKNRFAQPTPTHAPVYQYLDTYKVYMANTAHETKEEHTYQTTIMRMIHNLTEQTQSQTITKKELRPTDLRNKKREDFINFATHNRCEDYDTATNCLIMKQFIHRFHAPSPTEYVAFHPHMQAIYQRMRLYELHHVTHHTTKRNSHTDTMKTHYSEPLIDKLMLSWKIDDEGQPYAPFTSVTNNELVHEIARHVYTHNPLHVLGYITPLIEQYQEVNQTTDMPIAYTAYTSERIMAIQNVLYQSAVNTEPLRNTRTFVQLVTHQLNEDELIMPLSDDEYKLIHAFYKPITFHQVRASKQEIAVAVCAQYINQLKTDAPLKYEHFIYLLAEELKKTGITRTYPYINACQCVWEDIYLYECPKQASQHITSPILQQHPQWAKRIIENPYVQPTPIQTGHLVEHLIKTQPHEPYTVIKNPNLQTQLVTTFLKNINYPHTTTILYQLTYPHDKHEPSYAEQYVAATKDVTYHQQILTNL